MANIYSFNTTKREQKTIFIDTLDAFLKIVNNQFRYDGFIFRGISKSDEKYPKIIRNNRDYSFEREGKLLEQFEHYHGLYSKVRDSWEFITLAQHHGLETRLIDFSDNPFVAAFFSLYNSSSDLHVIYVANKKDYEEAKKINYLVRNGTFFGGFSEMTFANRIKHIFSLLAEDGKTVILEPNYGNERVFAQQGLFLIPPFVEKKNIDEIYENMPYKIVLDKAASEEILKYLSKNGFDEFHLMPDLSSTCFEINRITK